MLPLKPHSIAAHYLKVAGYVMKKQRHQSKITNSLSRIKIESKKADFRQQRSVCQKEGSLRDTTALEGTKRNLLHVDWVLCVRFVNFPRKVSLVFTHSLLDVTSESYSDCMFGY